MKVSVRIELTACTCEERTSTPSTTRSMRSACSVQVLPHWSHSAQKTAMKAKMNASRPSVSPVSRLKVRATKGRNPAGGTCTKAWRPDQKMNVASSISAAGTPKASPGP